MTSTVAGRIQELKDLNKKKGKDGKTKTYDLDHAKFGCDILLRYKPKASGTDKYSVDKGDRTPITDEEKRISDVQPVAGNSDSDWSAVRERSR